MKNLMIVLCVALLLSVAVGTASADVNAGINLKGNTTHGAPALELGYMDEIVGVYGQVGLEEVSGLVGMTLRLPDSPVFAFVGGGAKLVEVYYSATYDTHYEVVYRHLSLFDYDVSTTTDISYEGLGAKAFIEAGLGLDMGPLYWKLGYTNYAGNAVSLSMGASF